jgi:predicted phosphodiesterase
MYDDEMGNRGLDAASVRVVRTMWQALLLTLASLGCGSAVEPDKQRPAESAEVREVRALPGNTSPNSVLLPTAIASVKFAVIGDSGRGSKPQYEVAQQMVEFRKKFPFTFVIMNGDNIYEGPATAEDYRDKFERPYQTLLNDGVKFYAVLGNHDDPRQINYKPFNMEGHRYYTFRPPEDPITRLLTSVRFFAIDTTGLDRQQLGWLDEQLSASDSAWKICFFHHPMYTSGRYQRASAAFRLALEPMFVKYGVDVVFAGHEHFYERTTLQRGIQYFVSGGAGSLRAGDAAAAPFVARDFDSDYHFMLVEIERDTLSFQAISRRGETVDSGALHRRRAATSTADTEARPQSGAREP